MGELSVDGWMLGEVARDLSGWVHQVGVEGPLEERRGWALNGWHGLSCV